MCQEETSLVRPGAESAAISMTYDGDTLEVAVRPVILIDFERVDRTG